MDEDIVIDIKENTEKFDESHEHFILLRWFIWDLILSFGIDMASCENFDIGIDIET